MYNKLKKYKKVEIYFEKNTNTDKTHYVIEE
jgi:hypothetical protein